MNYDGVVILGAGVTGLAAGVASGAPVYEAEEHPGGICASYYVQPRSSGRLLAPPEDSEAYRFEIGGGHWIFGADPLVLQFIKSLVPVKSYKRRSSVFFSQQGLYVPYPLQNHLGHLGKDVASRALAEIMSSPRGKARTMAEWLESSFGRTLVTMFFGPFHERYTAGLWTEVAPQDGYKSPVDLELIIRGAFDSTPPVGYNVSFIYPVSGLDSLCRRMADRCRVNYAKRAVKVDIRAREVYFEDGSSLPYQVLISTVPLNRMVEMCDLDVGEPPDPYTSVLVLNIGAVRGDRCPDDYWLYIPDSRSGFHRVGFYSNVDDSFLPESSRGRRDRVSIYVERAYRGGDKPTAADVEAYSASVVRELTDWGFIAEAEVVDATWIDVAYTWSRPGSRWKERAAEALQQHGIFQVGRYGRWKFQGIAESIKDGLLAGIVASWNQEN